MARYLVTGGCGFIGGHLTQALLDAGHRVTVLDDLSSGFKENLPAGATLERGCVTDAALVARLAGEADGIVHLAAIASVVAAAADPVRAAAVNIGGVRNAVDAARTSRVPLVFASSAAVYGDAGSDPVREDIRCVPLSDYGKQKRTGETMVQELGPGATIVRPFNIYGPRQHPASPYSGVIARFISACRAGEKLQINGDGTQTRDFIYIDDIVRLFLLALTRPPEAALTVNGCSGKAVSLLTLAEAVAAACGREATLGHGPARPGDIRHSRGDPSRAATRLGFRASTGLADGLAKTLAWQRSSAQ